MTSSSRLLDHAFRSELERLSQISPKSNNARRRAEPRRKSRRSAASAPSEVKPECLPEDSEIARFFENLIRKPDAKSLLLLIDASETMERPSEVTGVRKYDQACKLAAALSIVLRSRYDRVQVLAIGQALGRRSPILNAQTDSTELLLQYLKHLRPGGKPRFVHILQRFIKRLPLSTECIIFSDLLAPEWEAGMAILGSHGDIHTSVLHISDPADLENSLEQLWLTEDSESAGRPLDIDISRQLRNLLKDNIDGDRLLVGGSIDYVNVMTDQAFEKPLLSALEAR